MVSTRLDPELIKAAKKLAIDQDRRLNDLLEEALGDLLKKYGKKETPPKK